MYAPFAGADAKDVVTIDGGLRLANKNLNVSYAELLARSGLSSLVADADYDPVKR